MNVLEKFFLAINKKREETKGIHVTSLVYDCLRRSYYTIKYGEGFFDLKTLITFWIGRQLHKTRILASHELNLEWSGIVGTVDDFEEGILIEKKSTTFLPKEPMDHHIRQLEYYALLLEKNGYNVKECHLVYIDINNKDIKAFPVQFRPLNQIEKEIVEKKEILESHLLHNEIPDRQISWLCYYCNFASICLKEEENESK